MGQETPDGEFVTRAAVRVARQQGRTTGDRLGSSGDPERLDDPTFF